MHQTVVILLSDKRSGSTMFQDAICRHPHVQTVAYSPHTYLETHHWLKGTVILGHPAKRGADGPLYEGYGSRANARTYMLDCLRGNLPGFETPEDDRDLIFSGWEQLCEKFAQPVFFEKSPQYLGFPASLDLMREWLEMTRFEVKFIGLTRNPLGVQYSASKLFHRIPDDRQYGWMELQQEMLDFEAIVGKERFLHLPYEAIIENPFATFERVCEYIGIEADPSMGEAVHDQSLNKWKDDPYFSLQLDERVKQIAFKFGYTEEDLTNPDKPTPPLHWRARKKLGSAYKLQKARLMDRFIKPIRLRLRGDARRKSRENR